MSEKRRCVSSICLKMGAKGSVKIELFDAADWNGPRAQFRLRVQGRWLDFPDGGRRYLSYAQVGALVAASLEHQVICPEIEATNTPQNTPKICQENEAMPTGFPLHARVSVPNGGEYSFSRELTRISVPPFRGYDGKWYVGCHLFGRGVVMIPIEDVILKDGRHV